MPLARFPFRVRRSVRASILWGMLAIVHGCDHPPAAPPQPAPQAARRPTPPLRVLVVDDAPLAENVALLRGEWAERTERSFEVTKATSETLPNAASDIDLIVYPSRWLGALVEGKQIQPLRKSLLEDEKFDWPGVAPVLRQLEIVHDKKSYALPLGSPPLLIVCRADLWADGADPPATWEAFTEILRQAARHTDAAPWQIAWEGHAPAYALLARVAATAWAPTRPDALFDVQTMAPRIATPPFVEALEWLTQWQSASRSADARPSDFAEAVAQVRRGDALATFGWPGVDRRVKSSGAVGKTRYLPLLASVRCYHAQRSVWEIYAKDDAAKREPPQMLGAAGRLISVTRATRDAVAVFRLAAWLAGPSSSERLGSSSLATLWPRSARASGNSDPWLATGDDETSVRAVERALTEGPVWIVPRLPAIDRYLDALSDAVRRAFAENVSCSEALEQAAIQWVRITEEQGRAAQSAAYRRHLGLD